MTLDGRYLELLELSTRAALGPAAWRRRKRREAEQLLAMAQRAGAERLEVVMLDLHEELRAAVRLRAPVPMEPKRDGALDLEQEAVLGITYPQAALALPMPGYSFVSLLHPVHGAFHPNIGRRRGQQLCLGTHLPAGIPVTELILLSYGLLTLQSVTMDLGDAAGVMNPDAALWWQTQKHLIPLTREPFFGNGRNGRGGQAR